MIQRSLTLSRTSLETFLTCQRRFRLRYLDRLPWPTTPLDEPTATAVGNGRYFHQQVERHFLQLPTGPTQADPDLQQWWHAFQSSLLPLPENARLFPELSLSVPLGNHHLTGRFDLLALGHHHGRPSAHLFDWKTSRPRPEGDLRTDWQTRLYLALLAEGSHALFDDARAAVVAPDDIALTYWYVREPNTPRTIRYSTAWHATNWAEIGAVLTQIDAQLADDTWPLTDQRHHCRQCAYQAYCARQTAGSAVVTVNVDTLLDEWEEQTGTEPDVVPQ